MHRSSELIVLAAPRDELPAWVGTLQDWSALGIVRDFVAIDLEQVAQRSWHATLVSEGRSTPVVLQEEIANRAAVNAVSLFSLGRVETEAVLPDFETSRILRDEVRGSLPGVPLTWGQVLVVGVTHEWPTVEASAVGWTGGHTVILSPESSHSPTGGKAAIVAEDVVRPLGLTHAAAGLASAVGLWAGAEHGVIHGDPRAGGGRITLLRTFTRHVSTVGSTSELLARVINVKDRYPAPVDRRGRRQLQRISDEFGAAARMADALASKHAQTLGPRPRASVARQRERMAAWEMIKRFFRFLWAAVRLAPETFAQALEAEAAGAAAPAVQRLLLGSNSAYQLTVREISGLSSDGELSSPVVLEVELDARIASLTGEERSSRTPRHDLPELWKDYVDGAMTLLDGHERSEDLPAATEAGCVAVVTDPRHVVAAQDTTFELPPEARRLVDVHDIPPNDFERMAVVKRMITEQTVKEPDSASTLTHVARRLAEWREQCARSYSGRVGRHISDGISGLRDEVLTLQESLRRHGSASGLDGTVLKDQMTLGRVTWIFLLATFGISGLLVWAGSREVLTWLETLGWVAGAWCVTFAALMIIFVLRQRKFFALIHERRRSLDQAAIDHKNLAAALQDLQRLLAVHRQYLDWSSVLSHFLEAPWGEVTPTSERTMNLGVGFGHNHRFGRLVSDVTASDDLARRAQLEVTEPGWLSVAWREFLGDLPAFEDQHQVARDRELLFSDARMGDQPVLTVWREAVVGRRRADVAGPLLDRLSSFVEESAKEAERRVLWTDGAGRSHDDSYGDFLGGVAAPSSNPGGSEFTRYVLADTPQSEDPWRVASTDTQDLTMKGGPLVVTQVSAPFPAMDLVFCRVQTGPSDVTPVADLGDAPQM